MVRFAAKFPELVEVMLCVGFIITASVQVGTAFELHVEAVFQSPEATDITGTSLFASAKEIGAEVKSDNKGIFVLLAVNVGDAVPN